MRQHAILSLGKAGVVMTEIARAHDLFQGSVRPSRPVDSAHQKPKDVHQLINRIERIRWYREGIFEYHFGYHHPFLSIILLSNVHPLTVLPNTTSSPC